MKSEADFSRRTAWWTKAIERTFSSRISCASVTPGVEFELTPTTRTSACSAANLSNLRCPGWTTLKLPETNPMVWSAPHEARIAWHTVSPCAVSINRCKDPLRPLLRHAEALREGYERLNG